MSTDPMAGHWTGAHVSDGCPDCDRDALVDVVRGSTPRVYLSDAEARRAAETIADAIIAAGWCLPPC